MDHKTPVTPPAWKLSEHDKWTIARRYQAGERVEVIAADFGISSWLVSYHARRRGVLRRNQPRKDQMQ